MKKRFTKHLMVGALLMLFGSGVFAQSNTYTWGSFFDESNWNDPFNWSYNSVPTSGDDVVIPSGPLITPRIFNGTAAFCRTLTISGNNDLAIEGSLTVSEGIYHTGTGEIFVERDLGKNGRLVYGPAFSTYINSSSGQPIMVYDQANTSAGYRDLGPTINGLTVGNLDDAGFTIQGGHNLDCYYNYSPYPNVQRYQENHSIIVNGAWNERWVSYTNPSSPLTPGLGYAVRLDAPGPFSMAHVGPPGSKFNSGPISVPVTRSTAGSGSGWNLLSNPYPAYLDLSTALNVNPLSLYDAHVFSATGQYTGIYYSVNTSGANTFPWGNPYIAPGQGFFVNVPSNGTFDFDHSMTSANPGTLPQFQKTGSIQNQVRVQLGNGTFSNNILAYTDIDATVGYDAGKDVRPFVAGSSIGLSFVQGADNLTINALETIDATTELPFNLYVSADGNYALELSEYNVDGLTPYLKDNQTNTLTDLSPGNSVTLNLQGGVAVNGRYAIVFSANAATGITKPEDVIANIFANKTDVFVYRNSSAPATVEVFNTLGQQLISKTISSNKETISLNQTATECVVVRITENGKVQTKRVLVTN